MTCTPDCRNTSSHSVLVNFPSPFLSAFSNIFLTWQKNHINHNERKYCYSWYLSIMKYYYKISPVFINMRMTDNEQQVHITFFNLQSKSPIGTSPFHKNGYNRDWCLSAIFLWFGPDIPSSIPLSSAPAFLQDWHCRTSDPCGSADTGLWLGRGVFGH